VIKLREGNPGKRPINPGEPKPPPAAKYKKLPSEFTVERAKSSKDAEGWQAPEAAREYKRLCRELEAQGLLTTLDTGLIEACYQAYGQRK
jgi:phage terminase small subunit